MFVKADSNDRVAMRDADSTKQSSYKTAHVLANQTAQPQIVLKIFKWNAWPAESTFRREELYLDECR